MSIDLAPHNKQGLHLSSRLMAGSGAAGFADAWPAQAPAALFGAVVTAPISLQPQRGLPQPRLAETPGGFLLATGGHNPGYRRVLRDHAGEWRRLGVPVLAALSEQAPEEWSRLAEHLEEDGVAAGIELPLPEHCRPGEVAAWLTNVRRSTTLPLLVKLPVTDAAGLAEGCVDHGADALVAGTAPPAAYPGAGGALVQAAAAGPMALPFTLRALHELAALQLAVPVIAAGGIHSLEDARLCLALGAVAVQIRSLMWVDPAAARRLAEALREE